MTKGFWNLTRGSVKIPLQPFRRATQARVYSLLLFTSKACMFITLLACVLVTAKTYIGDNIKCITGFEKQEHQAIETYCFISSTFTMVDLNTGVSVGRDSGGSVVFWAGRRRRGTSKEMRCRVVCGVGNGCRGGEATCGVVRDCAGREVC